MLTKFKRNLLITVVLPLAFLSSITATILLPASVNAQGLTPTTGLILPTKIIAYSNCGAGPLPKSYKPSFDLGCEGRGNPIADVLFAIIRFLSDGVGLVVIGSIVYAGIQYSASRGDPKSTAQAVTRMRSALLALLIFIFGYAILNYIIPAGFLH